MTYTYASADRLSSIASGGMTGTITRTSSQEALTVNFTGLYYSPHSTYNRILRNSYGQLQSHLASYTQYNFTSPTTFTIRDNTFTWDSNRLATRGEGDTTWNYTYDAKGQVEKAHRKFNATEVLAGSQSIYVYDDIGNRKELQEGGTSALNVGLRTTTYTANSLNQYDAITRPQSFDVTGKRTSTSATITVNGVSLPTSGYQPNDNGLHFRKEVANTPAASLNGDIYAALPGDIFEPVTVSQTINGTTTDLTNDLSNDPIQFVPPSVTATPPRYDLDGNLLSDGRWTYTWDGENRLVKMASIAWTQPSGGYLANATFPAITLEFAYDGLSRRVQKKTITSGEPTMEGYLYDGWNVLMISNLDPANGAHLARKWSCVWRPDVGSRLYARGSWQAAGGVGGLAWLQTGLAQTATMYTYQSVSGNAEVHIPMMDHMGNVSHYYQIKATGSAGPSPATVTGQVTANLDYDAFGREIRATGTKTPASGQPPGLAPGEPWVDNLPFHFSTKFTDRESGLNYYGYRFYDAVDGRWPNRDPIEEEGGLNLYGMVGNDGVNRVDYLGLQYPIYPPEVFKPGGAFHHTPSPGPEDQINPRGVRGTEGKENFTEFFDRRYPNTISNAKSILETRIKEKACASSDTEPNTVPNLVDGKDDVDVTQTNGRILDHPQSWWERNVSLGDFEFKAENIQITNWRIGQCAKCFDYKATIYVLEQTGTRKGEKGGFLEPVAGKRSVRMAEWTVSGSHCCDQMP